MEFHIWQFQEDKVRILFKDHNKFIEDAIKFFGSKKALATFLQIPSYLIDAWKRNQSHLLLKHIKKIVKKLRLDWEKIEKSVCSYKGLSTGKPILNPKLPIKETPELFALITHIICDGSVNRNGIPYYVNTEKSLISNFKKILKNTFGETYIKIEHKPGKNKKAYSLRFPKVIIELLEDFYNFSLYKAKRFPKGIFNLPDKFAIAIIKAFVDDEGNVNSSKRIGVYSTEKNLLKDLIRLLKEKLRYENTSEIRKKGEGYYYFYIKSEDIERYGKEIGFNHLKKNRKLKELIQLKKEGKSIGKRGKNKETKEKLLKLLNKKALTTYEIMKKLKINKSNINTQIRKLRNQNLIVQDKKIGQTIFWTRSK